MDDEILSIGPNQSRGVLEPLVSRLADGNVRISGSSIVFPGFCPRCGTSPAHFNVSVRGKEESSRSFSLPFCTKCGWTLNLTRYTFGAAMIFFTLFVLPGRLARMRIPHFPWDDHIPRFVPVLLIVWMMSWVLDQAFRLVFKPGVTVISSTKDAVDLEFENQMYADRFVEMNR